MTEYHVGCGVFGIYAGILNKKRDLWRNKSDVTDEAVCAVAQYLIQNQKEFHFDYHGKKYIMRILEGEENEEL